jgi:hypothetical protein
MTANASALGAVLSKTESAWGEDVDTFSSPVRTPIIQRIDPSGLIHEKLDPARVVQIRGAGTEHIVGTMGGEFVLRGHLHGHGSTTTGSTAATDLGNMLAWILGTQTTPADGTTFTGGTATAPTTTASGTVPTGSLIRAGTLGDGRGNGQFLATSTHSTTTLNLLTGMTTAPNNGDVLYSAETIHDDPTVSTVSESKRFFLPTADQRYIAHGCFPMTLTIGQTSPRDVPFWESRIGCSWWETEASLTWPVTDTYDSGNGPFNPAPVAGGSVFFAAHGTATRATLDVRAWSIEIQLGISPMPGHGVNAYQRWAGVRRTPNAITVSLTLDAQSASATPTHATNWATGGRYHMLHTLNSVIGQAVGIYLPCVRYIGNKPTQTDQDGRNSTVLQFAAYANDSVTTSALTQSQLRIGLA